MTEKFEFYMPTKVWLAVIECIEAAYSEGLMSTDAIPSRGA